MTTISIIIRNNALFSPLPAYGRALQNVFLAFNHKGRLTRLFLVILAVSAMSYLLSVFTIFGTGLELQELEERAAELKGAVERAEFALQEQTASVVRIEHPLLGAMEPITTIKYLREDGVVALNNKD